MDDELGSQQSAHAPGQPSGEDNGGPALETREADIEAPPQPIVRRGGTFESFKHRDFVWFWFGALVSNVGTWMQSYALGIVVFAFRKSEFDLGLINFISGIPVLFLAIAGGALADRVDRRKLLIWIQVILIAQAATLGWLYNSGRLASSHPTSSLLWVGLLGVIAGIFAALQFPAWQAMLPDLVPKESLLNGIALNSAQFQSSRLIGPLVAGALVVAGAGMGDLFYINAASFLFVIASLWVIRPNQGQRHVTPRGKTIETLLGGLRYAREDKVVGLLLLSTAIMTVFGFAYMTLLPAIVGKTLGFSVNTNPYNRAVAVIMAANGLGAMVGALSVASLPPTVRRNRIIPLSLLAFGVLLFCFSLSRTLWVTAAISAFAGAALMTTNSLANTSIQASVPPQLRGRVMGLFVMAFLGIMPISGLIFGSIGEFIGPSNAVLVGSIALIAWAGLLVARPNWLTPRGDEPEPSTGMGFRN